MCVTTHHSTHTSERSEWNMILLEFSTDLIHFTMFYDNMIYHPYDQFMFVRMAVCEREKKSECNYIHFLQSNYS